MAEYKCDCNDEVIDKSGVTIKYIEGEGVIHDVKCKGCDKKQLWHQNLIFLDIV